MKRKKKSEVINEIMSVINIKYPNADPIKLDKCIEFLEKNIEVNDRGMIIHGLSIDETVKKLAYDFELAK